jgi:cytochrome c5
MIKNWKQISLGIVLLAAIPLASQAGNSGNKPATGTQQQSKNKTVHPTQDSDGQQVFEQNCSRCHNAPESFSPRISGTVIRHMRVRANLSDKDEQALLRFLNP